MSWLNKLVKTAVPTKNNFFGLLPGADYKHPASFVAPMWQEDPVGIYGAFKAGGDTSGDQYAKNTFADITRNQYDDWLQRYYPRIQKLMDLSDHSLMNAQLNRVDALANQTRLTSQTGVNNQLARYGVEAPTHGGSDHSYQLNNALSLAAAKNGIREAESDRQLNILTGATSPLREQIKQYNSTNSGQ